MPNLTVGPNSTYTSIANAMAVALPGDTITLESGYSNEVATVTQNNLTLNGGAASLGITLALAVGVPTFTLTGTAPINILDASDGNGIVGNAGNNQITVTGGVDAVDGGLGSDRLVVDYRAATGAVTGDSTSNFTEAGGGGRMVTITDGTIEHFTILTGAGADTITTGDGDDIIKTGQGASTVTAGQGANTVIGGSNADTVVALDGGNFIDVGAGANTVTTGGGIDTILTGNQADTIVSGGGNDAVTLTGGTDTVDGEAGSDTLIIDYAAATTNVTGGVTGGNIGSGHVGHVADLVSGIIDFAGIESLIITTGSGNDLINSGDGADILTGNFGNDWLVGAAGNDSLYGNQNNDILDGGYGNDWIHGGQGDDLVYGGRGNDNLQGGIGNDTVVTDGSDTITENSGEGTDTVQSSVSFTLGANLENLTLTGSGNINGTGNTLVNKIFGNGGSNAINGGTGSDSLTGGSGSDTFIFNSNLGSSNVDTITDYNVVADTIRLENAIFTGLANGALAASAFVSNNSGNAADASDRIIYEADTGRLYFDKDGTGGAAKVLFADLASGLSVTSADFLVF